MADESTPETAVTFEGTATETKADPPSETSAPTQTAAKKDDGNPGRWRVRLSHPNERKKTVFSTVSEGRARTYITNHYPRGGEAYLEDPDGNTFSYENERQGEHGEDAEKFADFDPDAYQPPEEVSPPGSSAWADVEG